MKMDPLVLFGLSVFLSLVSSSVVARYYLWPRLLSLNRESALVSLVLPHMFLRFLGLSFLFPGVVSPLLPDAVAVPAAYGDLVAGLLAIVATVTLWRGASYAIAIVWIFNVWGTTDFLFAYFQGLRVLTDFGMLGAAFFIPTAIVPPLLVTHALIFRLLLRGKQ